MSLLVARMCTQISAYASLGPINERPVDRAGTSGVRHALRFRRHALPVCARTPTLCCQWLLGVAAWASHGVRVVQGRRSGARPRVEELLRYAVIALRSALRC
jgi:hypothetical protein